MPESAEVKIMTEFLKTKLINKIIIDVCFLKGQYKDEQPNGFEELEQNLPVIVENVECKGKFIFFTLFNENKYIYIMHNLGMSGRWQDQEDTYCRWFIELDNNKKIWCRDPRCLATLEFTTDKKVVEDCLYKLGPDILTPYFNLPVWNRLLLKYIDTNITVFLMNQEIISGIGNYIKCEALYYAKISPVRKVGSLTSDESYRLFEGIRIIPRISYNYNGVNLTNYSKTGYKGDYNDHLKIYGKIKARKDKTPDGRITYWDPKIQE